MNRVAFMLAVFVIFLTGSVLIQSATIVHEESITLGSITLVFLFDPTNRTDLAFMVTYNTTNTLYAIQVDPTTAIAQSAVCQSAITIPMIVWGRGCDGLTLSWSCASSDQQAIVNMNTLLNSFYLSYGSNECNANGGGMLTCLGPPALILPNQRIYKPVPEITDVDFMNSRGVAIFSAVGEHADLRAVTWIDIQGPQLYVQTIGCSDQYSVLFSGYYEPYYLDRSDSTLVNETRIYQKQTTASYQRVTIRRDFSLSGPNTLYVTFSTTTGVGNSPFVVKLKSTVAVTTSWISSLPQTLYFAPGNCNATFSIIPRSQTTDSLFVLNPPVMPTSANFHKNKLFGHFYQTAVMNAHVGILDEFGNLVHPYTKEGELGGGFLTFRDDTANNQLVKIPPDASYADYTLDCTEVNAKLAPVPGYGFGPNPTTGALSGAIVDAMDPVNGLCNFPFYDPVAISKSVNVLETKMLQCRNMGGVTMVSTQEYCMKPIQVQYCKKGWIMFQDYCYAKYDPFADSQYKVPSSQADQACKQLFNQAEALTQVTGDLKTWLLNQFILYKRIEPGHPYRVPLAGQRCQAYDYASTANDASFDVGFVQEINCATPAFSICRYHRSKYYVPHSDVFMHFNDIKTLRDGQEGVPHPGRLLGGSCGDGWCSDTCEQPCCRINIAGTNTSFKNFILNCQANGGGSCDDADPRKCTCFEGYGPNADWSQYNAALYNQYPCPCPAHQMIAPFVSQYYQMIDQNLTMIFPIVDTYAVCGGISLGTCYLEPQLNQGICQCAKRPNLIPGSPNPVEPISDGKSCANLIPKALADNVQLNGYIIEGFCNRNGIGCPWGESYSQQRLNEEYSSLFARSECRSIVDGSILTGCVCNNGWTGMACTSPSPPNIAQSFVYMVANSLSYVYTKLTHRNTVAKVKVYGSIDCPVPTMVQTVDDYNTNIVTPVNCVIETSDNRTWNCNYQLGTRVFVQVANGLSAISCQIQAFADWYQPCGKNPNPWAGALLTNEFFDSYDVHLNPQSTYYAPYGSTITECQCDPNHGGALCAFEISAYAYDFTREDIVPIYCGSNTIPARGQIGATGCECFIRQGGIIQSQFTGPACALEEVMVNGTMEMCARRGIAIPPSFSYGQYAFDITNINNDLLQEPLLGINPVVTNTSTVWTVLNTTVIKVNGRYWQFYPGQLLQFDGLQLVPSFNLTTVEVYAPRIGLPLNMSYACSGNKNLGIPTLVYPTWFTYVSTFICDNPHVDFGTPSCYTTTNKTYTNGASPTQNNITYCPLSWNLASMHPVVLPYAAFGYTIGFECIAQAPTWTTTGSLERFVSGVYSMVEIQSGVLEGTVQDVQGLAIGVMDCSSFIDRILIDVAIRKGILTTSPCQAAGNIPPHSRVLGAGYGMFHQSMPDLPPFDGVWQESNYDFVAAFVQQFCPNSDGTLDEDGTWDAATFDNITLQWMDTSIAQEISTVFSNDTTVIPTRTYNYSATSDPTNIGLYGNPYIHQSFLLTGQRQGFTFYGLRPGYMMTVPTGNLIVRALSLRIPASGIQCLQVYGPIGTLCATYYSASPAGFPVGTVIDVQCGVQLMTIEDQWVSLERIETLFWPNQTEIVNDVSQYNNYPAQYEITVVWSQLDDNSVAHFTNGDISMNGRTTSYQGLFQDLKTLILMNKQFPTQTVVQANCLKRGVNGKHAISIDTTNPIHRDFLKRIYYTFLGVRKCTDTVYGKTFARDPYNYKCIRDTEFAVGWRGGDPTITPALLGEEGGCLCTQGISKHPCALCVDGYGPNTVQEILAYQTFYNRTDLPTEYCSIPFGSSETNLPCNGYGTLVVDQTIQGNVTLNIFDQNTTRRCQSVVYGNSTYTLNQTADYSVDVMVYQTVNRTSTINVIQQRIFVDGVEKTILDIQNNQWMIFTDNSVLECIGWLFSTTHRKRLIQPFGELIDSNINFWKTKLVQYLD